MTSSTGASSAPASPGAIPHTVSGHLCIDFVNSLFTDHTGGGGVYDRLDLEDWRRWFANRCGLGIGNRPSAAVHRRLIDLRSLLRRLLVSRQLPDGDAVAELNKFLLPVSLSWQMSTDGQHAALTLRSRQQDWRAVMAATVVSYGRLVSTGGVDRVRVCDNPDCSYMFHDETRNRSRRWCEAGVCGNLIKVRRHRGARFPSPQTADALYWELC